MEEKRNGFSGGEFTTFDDQRAQFFSLFLLFCDIFFVFRAYDFVDLFANQRVDDVFFWF